MDRKLEARIARLERILSRKNEEESDYTSELSNSISLKLGKIREIVSLLADDVANYCDITSDEELWSDWESFRAALSNIDYMWY